MFGLETERTLEQLIEITKHKYDLSVKLLVNTIAVYRSFTYKPYYQYENVRHD